MKLADSSMLPAVDTPPLPSQIALPAGVGVDIPLSVQVGGQWSTAVLLGYAIPTVVAVAPQRGPTAGGSLLSVGGDNWGGILNPIITVGGVLCPIATGSYVPTPGQTATAQCILPVGQGTSHDVIVAIGGQSSVSPIVYNYSAPSVVSLSPASGPTSGRNTPLMVVDPVSGAVSFVPGSQIIVTVSVVSQREGKGR